VVDLLLKMGYGGTRREPGKAIGQAGDEGIDGIINEDRLGLDTVYIQAKWRAATQKVGRPEIQRFAGALQGKRARKGVFLTTSTFSTEARDYTSMIDSKIVLIDGDQLATLMMDFGVGVSSVATYDIKRVDSDYFTEDDGGEPQQYGTPPRFPASSSLAVQLPRIAAVAPGGALGQPAVSASHRRPLPDTFFQESVPNSC
jgi:hypothetical protein